MLEASRQLVYINEPMSLSRPPGGSPGVLDAEVRHRFHYVDPRDDVEWRSAFADTLRLRFHPLREIRAARTPYHLARGAKYGVAFAMGSMRGRRAMIDDPNAIFSAPWLTEVMDVRTVFLVRDPVGMIGSWRQLGWKPQLDALLAQPALLRDHLDPMRDEITAVVRDGDWLDQMCCLWNVGNRFVDSVRHDRDAVCVRRYEDLASDPMAQFESLYRFCGLEWSADSSDSIRDATTAAHDTSRSFSWSLKGGLSRTAFRPMDSRASVNRADQRLTADEVDRVRRLTHEVLERFPRTVS